jgi:hypothetical protein
MRFDEDSLNLMLFYLNTVMIGCNECTVRYSSDATVYDSASYRTDTAEYAKCSSITGRSELHLIPRLSD